MVMSAENGELLGPLLAHEALDTVTFPNAWKQIVVHHTVVETSPSNIALSHMARGLKGLAYHFLIVPTRGDRRLVYVSRRWLAQEPVPQTRMSAINRTAIGVALLGDFREREPGGLQEEVLLEVLGGLQRRVGARAVYAHRQVSPTECPGEYLSAWLGRLGSRADGELILLPRRENLQGETAGRAGGSLGRAKQPTEAL